MPKRKKLTRIPSETKANETTMQKGRQVTYQWEHWSKHYRNPDGSWVLIQPAKYYGYIYIFKAWLWKAAYKSQTAHSKATSDSTSKAFQTGVTSGKSQNQSEPEAMKKTDTTGE